MRRSAVVVALLLLGVAVAGAQAPKPWEQRVDLDVAVPVELMQFSAD